MNPKSKHLHGGRPKKKFEERCSKNQEKAARFFSKKHSLNMILLAAVKRAQTESNIKTSSVLCLYYLILKIFFLDKKNVAMILKMLISKPIEVVSIIHSAKNQTTFSETDAASLIIDLELSKNQYVKVRKNFIDRGYQNMLPPYYKVATAKKTCHPQNVTATAFSASVPLKDLLTHTIQRTVDANESIFNEDRSSIQELCAYVAYGGDSFTVTPYNQRGGSVNELNKPIDSSIYAVMVNLMEIHDSLGRCIYRKIKPMAAESVRPLLYECGKENTELIKRVI